MLSCEVVLGHNPRVGRLVALGLLLFAGIDLAFPSLCRAESAVPASSHSDAAALQEHQPEPDAPVQGPDDCFCCCVHVYPEPATRGIASLAELSEEVDARRAFEPDPSVGVPFHPPRP